MASRSLSKPGSRRPAILAASIAGFFALWLAPQGAQAQTWTGTTSGAWSTATNWNPATVPNSSGASVTFDTSSTTAVTLSQRTFLGSLTFTSNATSPYTISLQPSVFTAFFGAGVINNSGVTQYFEMTSAGIGSSGVINFAGSSSAGSLTQYTNDGGTVNGGLGGNLDFSSLATAGSATIINQGGTVTGAAGGSTIFEAAAKAGSATITTNGGSNGGGGGATYFKDSADGGTARAITNGNGIFDISQLTSGGMKIGSIEGSGKYYLGANSLTIGGNNLSTTVSGVIADGGAGGGTGGTLIKNGTGTLTLTAANTYTGGTTVNTGTVQLGTAGTAATLNTNSTIGVNNGGVFQVVNAGAALYGVTIANNMTNGVGGVGTVNLNSANLNLLTGTLTDGAAGQLGLTQSGSGTTIITNTGNTYSGPTTITGGMLQIGTAPTGVNFPGSIGASSPVSVSGGATLRLANINDSFFANNVTNGLGGTGILNVGNTTATPVTLGGALSDGAAGQLALKVNSGGAILTNAGNTYSGPTTVTGLSSLQVGTAAAPGSVGASSVIDISNSGTLILTNVSGGQFANNITNLSGTGPNPDGAVQVDSAGTITLSGVISDGAAGHLTFLQTGTGTTIFTGANTYTGLTEAAGGTLVVNGSIASTHVFTAGESTRLSGTGTLSGSVSLSGILAPGGLTTPGTLTMGNLDLSDSDGLAIFRLGQPTGTNDRVDVIGDLKLTGFDLVIQPKAGFGIGTYTLFNYGGTLTSNGINTLAQRTRTLGYQITVSTAVSGKVQIVVSYLGGGQFWDGSGAINNGVVSGGSGNWTTLGNNWANSNGTANSTWQGGTAVFAGTAGTVTLTSPITAQALIFNSTGYTIGGTQVLTMGGSAPAINVANPGASATISAPISGSTNLGAGGPGKLILANSANSLLGGMTITTGTVQIGTATAAGSIGDFGSFSIQQGGTLSLVNVSGNFTNQVVGGDGGATLNINSANTVTITGRLFENGLSGVMTLTQTGTGTTILASTGNTYRGDTIVSRGTLQIGTATFGGSVGVGNTVNVGTGGSLSVVNTGVTAFAANVTNGLGGTGTLAVNSTGTITVYGNLSDGVGKLAFTQSGTGTTIVNGTETYTGATNVTAGTLELDGLLASGTTVNVSTAGTLTGLGTINGSATLTGSGIINFGATGNIVGTLGATGGRWNGVGTVGGLVTASGSTNTFFINGTLTAPAGLSVIGGAIGGTGTLNGNLNYTSSSNSTFAGVIAGTGNTLTVNAPASTLTLSGNNTYTGATSVNGGTLQIGNGTTGSLGATAVTVNNSGVFATNLATGSVLATDVILNSATSAFNAIQSGTNTLSGALSGAGVFNQKGTGTTILSKTDTFTGAANVTAGTLQIGDGTDGALVGTSGVNVSGTGKLAIDLVDNWDFSTSVNLNGTGTSFQAIQSGTTTISTAISGTGAFNQNGPGTTVLKVNQTYTGATNVNGGTLQLDSAGLSASSIVHVGTAGSLYSMSSSIPGNVTLTGNGHIYLNNSTIGGTLSVTGGNWDAWGNTGTVNGVVTASSGVFHINGALNALSGLKVTGGTITGNGSVIGNLNYTSSSSSTFGGVITGSGSTVTVNNAGATLILTGINTYTGATTISAGTLQIGDGTTPGNLAGTSGVTVSGAGSLATNLADGATFSVPVTLSATTASLKAIQSGTNTISGVIGGTGAFNQNGTGTTILSSAETYTGPTNVNAGTLEVDGSLSAGSIVNVGTGGTLSGTGTVLNRGTLTGNGTINFGSSGNIVGTLGITGGNWNGAGSVGGLVTASSGIFHLNGSLTAPAGLAVTGGTLAGTGTLTGKLNYTSTSNSTFGGVIAGPGVTLTKAGTSTLILAGTSTYTGITSITAGTLQIGDGVAAGNLTGTSGVTVSSTGILATNLADGATFSAPVTLSATTASLKAIQSGTNTISGVISGTGTFNQNGSGTTILNTAETYTGATTVTTGTLEVDGSLATASVVKVLTGGTLSGSGTVKGNATLTGNGAINFGSTGNIVGTLGITGGNWNGLGTVGGLVTSSSGAFNLNGSLTAPAGLSVTGGTLAGTGTLNGKLTYASTASSTFGGVIAGTSTLTKSGTSTLTLTGTETYTGATTVSAGTLQIGNGTSGSLAGTSGVTASGTGILAINLVDGSSFTQNIVLSAAGASVKAIQPGTNTISGLISGTGTFNQSGAGTTILNKNETYTGATTVTTGTLEVDGSLATTSTVKVLTGGTLSGTGTIKGNATLTGNGIINFGSGGNIVGTLGVTGGNWNGLGTVGGLVTSSSGAFNLGGSLTAPTGLSITGGTLAGNGTLTGKLTYASTASSTFGGVIAGTGTLAKSGASTLALTGTNTYSGATTVTAGTLQVGNGAVAGASLGSGNVAVSSGATLAIDLAGGDTFSNNVTDTGRITDIAPSGTHTIASTISGAGTFAKTGAGTVVVTGANTYTGATTVSGGTLLANNTTGFATGTGTVSINNGGTLGGSGTVKALTLGSGGILAPGAGSIGASGTTLHASSLIWNAGGTLKLQLGSSAGDALALTGAFNKGTAGSYTLDLIDAGVAPGSYTLATYASTNFLPSNFTLELPAGYDGSLVQTSTSLSITLSLHASSVSGGTLTLNGNNPSGGGVTTLSGGTLSLGTASTYSGSTLIVNGANTTTVSGGTVTFSGGTGTSNLAFSTANMILVPQGTVNTSGATLSAGTGTTLIKQGTSTLTLSGAYPVAVPDATLVSNGSVITADPSATLNLSEPTNTNTTPLVDEATFTSTRTIPTSVDPLSTGIQTETIPLTLTPTPEPGSAMLLAFGTSMLIGWRRRRRP